MPQASSDGRLQNQVAPAVAIADTSSFEIEAGGCRPRRESTSNPLSYEVDALRTLLIGTPGHLALDVAVLAVAAAAGIAVSASLLGRLAR